VDGRSPAKGGGLAIIQAETVSRCGLIQALGGIKQEARRMEISARIRNGSNEHEVSVLTAGKARQLAVPAKASGRGSSVNGGEFLMAALATCYCNDLYREAERLGIEVAGCEVVATTHFNGVGLAAESITYSARVESQASPEKVEHLLSETDRLAEIHNTLRAGCPVQRIAWRELTD
jgi:organic hydroperoxide reductase OsmC/OhrA